MMKLRISHLTFKGIGVGCEPGGHERWRIAKVLPGELVEARPLETERGHHAILEEVLEASPDRRPVACCADRHCAACQMQCLSPERQRSIKGAQWAKLLQRIADVSVENVSEPHSPRLLFSYRNRTDLLFDHGCLGLRSLSGAVPDFTPLSGCLIQSAELNALVARMEELLAPFADIDTAVHFTLEEGFGKARITIYSSSEEKELAIAFASSLSVLSGASILYQALPPRGSHVYPPVEVLYGDGFYLFDYNRSGEPLYALKGAWTPVSRENAHLIRDLLYAEISEINLKFDTCVEMGCGCGTHTDIFSSVSSRYIGVDASWNAILSAEHNAGVSGWRNVEFRTGTDDRFFKKFYLRGNHSDLIVLHSCRLPFSSEIAEYCRKLCAREVLVVAPTAYAFSQEIKYLKNAGFELKKLHLCETMPHTYHMMGIARLSKE